MKIPREARNTAKKLFDLCRFQTGGVDPANVRSVIEFIEKSKPRGSVAILTRFHKLVELELKENCAVIECAVKLTDEDRNHLEKTIATHFGKSTNVSFEENKDLLGGMRIRKGSMVWDGSIQGRLSQLKKQFN